MSSPPRSGLTSVNILRTVICPRSRDTFDSVMNSIRDTTYTLVTGIVSQNDCPIAQHRDPEILGMVLSSPSTIGN